MRLVPRAGLSGPRLLAVLIALCASASCAYPGTCAWFVIVSDAPVKVIAPRKVTAPQECACKACAAPGEFELRGAGYVLQFWNGDRADPILLVRARNEAGEALLLTSEELKLRPIAATQIPRTSRWREFDYWSDDIYGQDGFLTSHTHFPEQAVISVRDAHGQLLGTSQIRLKLETRREFRYDSL